MSLPTPPMIWVTSVFKAVILKPEALQKKPIPVFGGFSLCLSPRPTISPNFGLKVGHSAL